MKLKNLKDVLETRLAKRSISMKALKYGTEEKAFDGAIRQDAEIVQGIPQETAKEISKQIKELKLKVQVSIQGEKIRVSAKDKDDLQAVIQFLKGSPHTIPLQFINFRTS